jgi:hypothetical protein
MATHVLHGRSGRRIRLDDHLPVDHRLNLVYRIGAGLMGLGLVVFGIFGIIDEIGFFADSRPGPLPANKDFLARHPEFEHDRERNERFLLSHHPLGWMRRIR